MRTAKLLKEASLIAEEINLGRFADKVPNATLTVRLTEILDLVIDLNNSLTFIPLVNEYASNEGC